MLEAIASAQRRLLVIALGLSCFAVCGCVESSFELASASRLPAWIVLPPGLSRADVSVTLSYYTWGDAKFELKNKTGKSLAKITGKIMNNYPLQLPGCRQPYDRRCSAFEVVFVGGAAEVMEHKKMEPVFYVNDNPGIRDWALAAVGRAENKKPLLRNQYWAWRYGQLRAH